MKANTKGTGNGRTNTKGQIKVRHNERDTGAVEETGRTMEMASAKGLERCRYCRRNEAQRRKKQTRYGYGQLRDERDGEIEGKVMGIGMGMLAFYAH
jgi:hypothetical protein